MNLMNKIKSFFEYTPHDDNYFNLPSDTISKVDDNIEKYTRGKKCFSNS